MSSQYSKNSSWHSNNSSSLSSGGTNKHYHKKTQYPVKKFPDGYLYLPDISGSQIIPYNQFKAVQSSSYSIEHPCHIEQLIPFIKGAKTLIDANAHIGGFSLAVAKLLDDCHVTAIELDECTYNALTYNASLCKTNNVQLVNMNSLTYLDSCDVVDVLWFDPEWGGRDYKFSKALMLYMSGQTITDIVSKYRNRAKKLVIKVPFNFDITSFNEKVPAYRLFNIFEWGKVSYNIIVIE